MTEYRLPIVVAGAGAVGVCSAVELLTRGHSVVLLDPETPASGCSAGNAGVIAAEAIAPLASTRMLAKLPSMLMRASSPVRLDPGYLPQILPWMLEYLKAAGPEASRRSTRALSRLLVESVGAWQDLLQRAGAMRQLQDGGWLFAYPGARAFAADAAERELQRHHGIEWRLLGAEDRRTLAPALSPRISHVVHYPDSAWVADPQAMVRDLAERFVALGGRILAEPLQDVETRDGSLSLTTPARQIPAAALVVSMGADSASWVRRLEGFDVPLQSERGYHLQYHQGFEGLAMPVMFSHLKIVATPMRQGLRLAGTAEFSRPHRAPDYGRADAFAAAIRPFLPGLPQTVESRWMGRRPTLPDSLPVISRSPGRTGVYYNFGHQHIGLTLAAVSARRLADLVEDRDTATDQFADLAVGRFSRR